MALLSLSIYIHVACSCCSITDAQRSLVEGIQDEKNERQRVECGGYYNRYSSTLNARLQVVANHNPTTRTLRPCNHTQDSTPSVKCICNAANVRRPKRQPHSHPSGLTQARRHTHINTVLRDHREAHRATWPYLRLLWLQQSAVPACDRPITHTHDTHNTSPTQHSQRCGPLLAQTYTRQNRPQSDAVR